MVGDEGARNRARQQDCMENYFISSINANSVYNAYKYARTYNNGIYALYIYVYIFNVCGGNGEITYLTN